MADVEHFNMFDGFLRLGLRDVSLIPMLFQNHPFIVHSLNLIAFLMFRGIFTGKANCSCVGTESPGLYIWKILEYINKIAKL